MKKPFHKFIIPPDDPVFKYDYSYLFFKDKESKRRFYSDYKLCKAYFKRKAATLNLEDKAMRHLRKTYMRKSIVNNFTVNPETQKKHTRKSKV